MGVLVGALNIGEGLPYLVNALGGLNWRVVIITTSLATAGGGIITRWGVTEGPYRSAQAKFDIRQTGSAVRNKRPAWRHSAISATCGSFTRR